MAYVSLYRKWRSQNFEELIGQSHVTTTLKNAIRSGRVSQAYLFCGPRGTGKTSLARIFAKALNCPSTAEGEPCGQCPACRSITEGVSLDVIEIDAASNTQVEKVREFIINRVDFLPTEGKYKIYIIDEVHKFSNSSFNALLKTLEEPPPHVIFILATTHPQDLPPTILSRCQRFDFRRISAKAVAERLRMVSEKEGFSLTEEAIALLAEAADGSMRDALVLLEQVASLAGPEIAVADVTSLLGLTEEATLMRLDEIIAGRKTVEGLRLLADLIDQGRDLERLAEDATGYYRRLILLKASREAGDLLNLPEERLAELRLRSDAYDSGEIMRILKNFMDLRDALRDATQRRLLWEMTLIRLTRWQEDAGIESLRRGFLELQKKMEDLHASPPPKAQPAPPVKTETSRSLPPPPSPVNLSSLWKSVLQAIKKESMALYIHLNETRVLDSAEGALVVGFTLEYPLRQAEKEKKYIEAKAAEIHLAPIPVVFRLMGGSESGESPASVDESKKHREFVEEANNLFGGGKIIP